jgi:hypothetical protein
MDEQSSPPLGAGLFYEDILPLDWHPIAETDAAQVHVDEANAEFLRVMAALEGHTPEPSDNHPELAAEISRVEFKVNLLLDMVGKILAQHLALPQPVSMKLNAQGVEWFSTNAPQVGQRLHVELYLRPDYPRPLVITGRVVSVEQVDGGTHTTVSFEDIDGPVLDWLEKTVFRHHRRRIAHYRRGQPR